MLQWPNVLKKPRKLSRGDRIAIVTPSWGGPACFPERFDAGLRYIEEEFGLQVELMPNARKPAEWLYENPEARADDIMQAFSDPAIAGVFVSIGGDDSIRLLPHLEPGVIADNPKVFLGYSDATVLHFACLKAGVVSFYGPTVMAGFAENGGMHALAKAAIRQVLFSTDVPGPLPKNTEGWTDELLDWADPENQARRRKLNQPSAPCLWQGSGKVRGRLIGGCAEVLEMLKATALWPNLAYWDDAILFYETSEEAPAPATVARWLRNFGAQGILGRLAGIVLGRPGGGVPVDRHEEYGTSIATILAEYGLKHTPLLTGLDFGHTDPMVVLPYGVTAELDCARVKMTLAESAVVR